MEYLILPSSANTQVQVGLSWLYSQFIQPIPMLVVCNMCLIWTVSYYNTSHRPLDSIHLLHVVMIHPTPTPTHPPPPPQVSFFSAPAN